MPPRHPAHPRTLPTRWLMTDERGGDPVALAERLPRGTGIVFRHHATPPAQRRALLEAVARVARRRRLVLVVAGDARARGVAGVHNRRARDPRQIVTRAVHSPAQIVTGIRAGADLLFVSPVFATRSHPDARPLGVVRLGLLLGRRRVAAIALGGMNEARFARVARLPGVIGWAGIDAWDGRARA